LVWIFSTRCRATISATSSSSVFTGDITLLLMSISGSAFGQTCYR
jgi:hypothetical protein